MSLTDRRCNLFAQLHAGKVEAYEFTGVDGAFEAGLSLKGSRWRRADDTVSVAGLVNGISATHERHLNVDGTGTLVGDGRQPRSASEQIGELHYALNVWLEAYVTADYQRVVNIACNGDRGPASMVGIAFMRSSDRAGARA